MTGFPLSFNLRFFLGPNNLKGGRGAIELRGPGELPHPLTAFATTTCRLRPRTPRRAKRPTFCNSSLQKLSWTSVDTIRRRRSRQLFFSRMNLRTHRRWSSYGAKPIPAAQVNTSQWVGLSGFQAFEAGTGRVLFNHQCFPTFAHPSRWDSRAGKSNENQKILLGLERTMPWLSISLTTTFCVIGL